MKKTTIKCLLPLVAFAFSCTTENNNKSEQTMQHKRNIIEEPTTEQRTIHGLELVEKMGCNDCHSPKIMTDHGPVPDPDRLLSGHSGDEKLADYDKNTAKNYVLFNMNNTAAIGPWGTSFAANLTPDPTGLGNWTIEQFTKAMREGKYKGMDGSRTLLPPMPWPGYSKLSDEELLDIFLYLKSIKPVSNLVPGAILAGK